MSLAAQFGLDLFMTGYDLWAAHPSVPAAAHYDLAHSPADHTVSALLLVWDGDRLLADDAGALTTALGSPDTRRAPVSTGTISASAHSLRIAPRQARVPPPVTDDLARYAARAGGGCSRPPGAGGQVTGIAGENLGRDV